MNYLTTDKPSERVSNKYKFISTARFIADVERAGFKLNNIKGSRNAESLGKHLLTFSIPDAPEVHGSLPKLYVLNSHDGSSSFRLMLGFLRIVCENGLIVGTMLQNERVIHVGYAREKVQAALDATILHLPKTFDMIQNLAAHTPTEEQLATFAYEASQLRSTKPDRISELYTIRRQADTRTDAYTMFNRVQENLIRGNFSASKIDPTSLRRVRVPVRRLTAVAETVRINRALWDLAEKHLLPQAA